MARLNRRLVLFKGAQRSLWDLGKEYGIHYNTLCNRILLGWDIEKALSSRTQRNDSGLYVEKTCGLSYHRESKKDRLFEHQRIAEKAIGKKLPTGAMIHHVDGDGLNNKNSNLVICQDTAYHKLLHLRQRAIRATGDPRARRCYRCKEWDDISSLYMSNKNIFHRGGCKRRKRKNG